MIFIFNFLFTDYNRKLMFHFETVLKHMSDKKFGRHKSFIANFAFRIFIIFVTFEMRSQMSRSSVDFIAPSDHTGVMRRRRDLIGSGITAFDTGTF